MSVYANADSADITNINYSIQCTEDYGIIITRCNITLDKNNYKEGVSTFRSAQIPTYTDRMIVLECASCVLETFPNELLSSEFQWRGLNFANSQIKYLKMNDLSAMIAPTILSVYLKNNSITHLDDESFPPSNYIINLDVSYNMIVNVTGTETFSKMPEILLLNLEHNHIAYLDPLVFKNLGSLQHLKLNNNRLLDTFFTHYLAGTPAVLTLSNNPIATLEENIYASEMQLSNTSITNCSIGWFLQDLEIIDGCLEDIDLSSARNLWRLNLSSNHLKHFEFIDPPYLEVLDLSNNKLEAIRLGHAGHLKSLNLTRNNFTRTFLMALPASLQDMNLSHNKITDVAHELFKNLRSLKFLNLAHCALHTLNAQTFLPHSMEFLDFSYNKIAELDLNMFQGLGNLKELHLNGNKLSDLYVEDTTNSTSPYRLGISDIDWNCKRLKVVIDMLKHRNINVAYGPCNEFTCRLNIYGIACHSDENEEKLTSTAAPANDSVILQLLHNVNNNFNELTSGVYNTSNNTDQSRNIFDTDERPREITTTVNPNRTAERNTPIEDNAISVTPMVLIPIGILVFVGAAIYIGLFTLRKRGVVRIN